MGHDCRTMKDYQGAYVRARNTVSNASARFAPGTVFKVEWATSQTWWLETLPCPTCGVQLKLGVKGARRRELLDFLGFDWPLPSLDGEGVRRGTSRG